MFNDNLLPQAFQSLTTQSKEQATLFQNSQETANVLFKQLQGTKVLDEASGEQLPMLSPLQVQQISKKLNSREDQSKARMNATLRQIDQSRHGLTKFMQSSALIQQQTQKDLIDFTQIEDAVIRKYAAKVNAKVQSLTQIQSLLEGEISEAVIQEVNRIKEVFNRELDASGVLERQGVHAISNINGEDQSYRLAEETMF